MAESAAFYILKPEDAMPVSLLCAVITEGIMVKNEKTRLKDDMMDAYKSMLEKLQSLKDDNTLDLPLTVKETFALQHAIVQSSYAVKGHIMLPNDKKLPVEAEEEFIELFEMLKVKGVDLLWRLTVLLDYNDYGLDTLEKIYEIKTGVVRKLKVDNVKEMSGLTLNEPDEHALHWAFQVIKSMKAFQEDSEVARRLYSNQFMNMADFNSLAEKFLLAKKGEKISLTRRDCIILYWVTAFSQRIYITDIADVLRDIAKDLPEADFGKIRKFMLHYYGILLNDMEKASADDAEMLSYYHKVKEWEF